MRPARWLFILALACPGLASAQDCFDCVLGIYDDPSLLNNTGTISPGEPKDVYVGLRLSQGIDSFAGVEFSVYGFNDGLFLLGAHPLGPRALVFGTIPAPSDTSATSSGVGGVSAAWSECWEGSVALFRLVLYTEESLTDRVLIVKRAYPPTNPNWITPIMTRCDRPQYTASKITGGCFVLNPSGGVVDCSQPQGATAVTQATWTTMKSMYR